MKKHDALESKHGEREKSEKDDSAGAGKEATAAIPDGGQADGQLADPTEYLPAIEKQRAMRERPSMIAAAKWYDRVFFSWAFKVITVSDQAISAYT